MKLLCYIITLLLCYSIIILYKIILCLLVIILHYLMLVASTLTSLCDVAERLLLQNSHLLKKQYLRTNIRLVAIVTTTACVTACLLTPLDTHQRTITPTITLTTAI